MDKIPIYTDFLITQKSKENLKNYFDSLKRNLPDKWVYLRDINYADKDTFRILNNVICLQTPWYTNDSTKTIFHAKIYLGLTGDAIISLKTIFTPEIPDEYVMEYLGYIIHQFHQDILKPNKNYDSFIHEFKLGGVTDENWKRMDIREERLIRLHSKSDGKIYSLAKGERAKVADKEIFYTTPNNISLSLSLMKKSHNRAKTLFTKLISKNPSNKINLRDEEMSELYDYFEEIQTSIIFSYIAVEAFTNAAIPEKYTFKKFNEKGIEETWNKENIERWMQTSEKISKVLPEILKSNDIKSEKFWSDFKDLEKIRNEIVHQKTIDKGTKLDSALYKEMINPSIFEKVKSCLLVIDFYYKLDNAHPFFPLGLGIAKFQISHIESMQEHFKPVGD